MIPVRDAYQEYMDDLHYRRMEKALKTQKTKAENEQKNISIQRDIMYYFKQGVERTKEEDEGVVPLLDGTTPSGRDCPPSGGGNLDVFKEYEDFINQKDVSAFTVTFKQIHRDHMNESQLRLFLKNAIKSISFRREIPIKYMLSPDIDAAGNFHYHGAIKIPLKYMPTFKRLMTNAVGFIKISYMTNPKTWKLYTFKDVGFSNGQIEKLFLIDHFI